MSAVPQSLKILFIGNSFSVDTMEHVANIALGCGVQEVRLGTLYYGACSIGLHHEHASGDLPAYEYYTNSGQGWTCREGVRIREALVSEEWDWVVIQHGTKNGSRNTSASCYEKLDWLIDYCKQYLPAKTKIAFNMTWLGEPEATHPEIVSYGGDTRKMRAKLEEVMRQVICENPKIDCMVPTGTAIENARTTNIGTLTRDLYHLSYDKGRFIAGLALVSALADVDALCCTWRPDGVDDYAFGVAVEAVRSARRTPLQVTTLEM